jgi:PII-like signaling protein
VAEPHVAERRSKVDQLLRRATREMAGATVLAAHQGFGRRHSHEPTMWHRVDEVPLTVIIVDEPDRVREFLTRAVREVLPDVVAVISSVRVIRYRHDTGAESS